MKIDLLLKIQKILGLLFSMLTEIENAKSEVENDCHAMRQKFDTQQFNNIITSFLGYDLVKKMLKNCKRK